MDFEPLERGFRNWRRTWSRIRPPDLPEPFHYAANIGAVRDFFSRQGTAAQAPSGSAQALHGECHVCRKSVDFAVEIPADGGPINWRETLTCPGCGLINRWRSCIHLFEAICEPTELDRVYLTETLSPVYVELAARYPLLEGSEFVPQARPGEVVELHGQQVRNEDVTRLSFADRSLEAVLCFDVLEHVPDYRAALREFRRVLAPGGQLVLSVPFSFLQQTVVRAVVSSQGITEHLQPPCYHGDPLSAAGVLAYYDFGLDLLDEMRRAGFSECFLVCYQSARWGYLQENVAYVARRLRR
jgi:SAM-dependent methyltransferase